MPRQRRRRRRPRSRRGPQGALRRAAPGLELRPWWRPTVGIVLAFSVGLWLGALLAFSETVGAVAFLAGALGMGMGLSRLLTGRLRERRRAQLRGDTDAEYDPGDDET